MLYDSGNGVTGPRQIVYSNGMLYWTQHSSGPQGTGEIIAAPADGSGTPTLLFTVPSPYLPWGIDIFGDTLFWTEFEPNQAPSNDRVMTGAADGTGSPSVLHSGSFGQLRGIAAGANIFGAPVQPEETIPTLSGWGLVLLIVLVIGAAAVILRRTTAS